MERGRGTEGGRERERGHLFVIARIFDMFTQHLSAQHTLHNTQTESHSTSCDSQLTPNLMETLSRSPHAPFPPLTRLLHASCTPRAGACARRPRTLSIDMSGGDATVGITVWPGQSGELHCTGFVQVRDSKKKSLVKNAPYY